MPNIYPYDLSAFGGRLNWAMDEAGFEKVRPFAQFLEMPESSIRAYLGGRAKFAGATIIVRFAKALGVNSHWLSTGQGPVRPGEVKPGSVAESMQEYREDLPTAHRLALETMADLIRDMDEQQVLEFHRTMRDLARRIRQG
jgi:hypothetical protein